MRFTHFAGFSFSRSEFDANDEHVDYTIASDTATAAEDFEAVSGTLSFFHGERQKVFLVSLFDDDLPEGNESVELLLQSPTEGIVLGAQRRAMLIVEDDEETIEFSVAEYLAAEHDGFAEITVLRTGANRTAAAVALVVETEEATHEVDFIAPAGQVAFGPGENQKIIRISIADDDAEEADETLQLTLLTLNAMTDPGFGAFEVKVSTEEQWDTFEFLINGRVIEQWTGKIDWGLYVFEVPGGRFNKFEWRYTKDPNFSSGADAAFIDNVFLPFPDTTPPDEGSAFSLSIQRVSSAEITIQLLGASGRSYLLQASSDLVTWQTIHTYTSIGESDVYMEMIAPASVARFYRALEQPEE